MALIRIAGAGPAGTAAALAALLEGAEVELRDRSRFPRHKVCGEFISPGAAAVLERLGVWREFELARPATIRRFELHLNGRSKACALEEPAFGLSRYKLDYLLVNAALDRGAVLVRGAAERPHVLATGRAPCAAPRGKRLFGFKAHFRGPATDAVELFFHPGGYTGINGIEDGFTNVCGLATEEMLRARDFDFDAVLRLSPALAGRVAPLGRVTEWLAVGPVSFGKQFISAAPPYRAGDALGFVDPFTGTGILNALITGRLAGIAAARGTPVEAHLGECRRAVERPFAVSALVRRVVSSGWAGALAGVVPAQLLFRLTRPQAA